MTNLGTSPARRRRPTLLSALELVDQFIRQSSIAAQYGDSGTAAAVAEAIRRARMRRSRGVDIVPRRDQTTFMDERGGHGTVRGISVADERSVSG